MNVVFHRLLLDDCPDPIVPASVSGDIALRRNGAKPIFGCCTAGIAGCLPMASVMRWERLRDPANKKSEGRR